MIEITGLIILGFFIGTFGTLIGIGGGPIIVPFLIIFYRLVPLEIVATSLFIIMFNVLSGTIFYARQKRIDIESGTKFGTAAIPGALIGTFILQLFTARFFETFFGLLLLALAVYVIFSVLESHYAKKQGLIISVEGVKKVVKTFKIKSTKSQLTQRVVIDSYGKKYKYRVNEKLGIIFSAGIGFISPIIGIGGGVIHMPLMTKVLNFPVHIASATCHYIMLISLPFAIIPHIIMDTVQYGIAIPLAIGTIFGARIGANVSRRYSGKMILVILGITILMLAIRLLINF